MLNFLLLSAEGEGAAVEGAAVESVAVEGAAVENVAVETSETTNSESVTSTEQPAKPEKPSQPWTGFLLPVLMVAFVWFIMIRPENKRRKAMNKFREGIKKGDKVVTAGGIHGIVREVKDATLNLEIDNNVHITIDKSMVVAQPTEAAAKK